MKTCCKNSKEYFAFNKLAGKYLRNDTNNNLNERAKKKLANYLDTPLLEDAITNTLFLLFFNPDKHALTASAVPNCFFW